MNGRGDNPGARSPAWVPGGYTGSMDSARRGGAPRGRFLVAMRPEPTSSDAQDLGRVLGLSPELARDVFGGGWPRIIAARSSWEEADALARVLSARGREAVAWDTASPLVELFHAETLQVETGQLVFEQRGRAHRIFPLQGIQCVIDLRVRAELPRGSGPGSPEELPDRALVFVPTPGGWNQPGVLSTRSIEIGESSRPQLAAAQLLQNVSQRLRPLLSDRMIELRTSAARMGVEEDAREEGDSLERMLQLLARLPPLPPGSATPPSAP